MTAIYREQNSAVENNKKTWSGRFNEPVSELVERYTASIGFDQRLAEYDIQGSLAHAQMLATQGIISHADRMAIEQGLNQIREEIRNHQFVWQQALEDVHLNIEKRLTALVGDAGKRLHTARSRNDQVATDIRLFLRASIDEIISLIKSMQRALLDLAEQHLHTVMPGFTHLQVAQPISFGHHLMAYFEMLKRDVGRLSDCRKRVNQLPLGAAALAGTSYPINRELVAELLGFEGVCGEFSGCCFRSGFCHRIQRLRGTHHDAFVPYVGRIYLVDESSLWLHSIG
jgi:argininosuccinate lyase